jgi:Icc-related predicted phosphoesterase
VEGEPEEIFPFLGSSRLVEPIDRLGVDVVVHGHAHHGSHQGKTPRGIPVYNVAEAIMRQIDEERPYLIVEL